MTNRGGDKGRRHQTRPVALFECREKLINYLLKAGLPRESKNKFNKEEHYGRKTEF
jgi:hypothetical protein